MRNNKHQRLVLGKYQRRAAVSFDDIFSLPEHTYTSVCCHVSSQELSHSSNPSKILIPSSRQHSSLSLQARLPRGSSDKMRYAALFFLLTSSMVVALPMGTRSALEARQTDNAGSTSTSTSNNTIGLGSSGAAAAEDGASTSSTSTTSCGKYCHLESRLC